MEHYFCRNIESDHLILQNIRKVIWNLFGIDYFNVAISCFDYFTQDLKFRALSFNGDNINRDILSLGLVSKLLIVCFFILRHSFEGPNADIR